jgi:hypothetical protein
METAVLDQRADSKPNTNPVTAIVVTCYRVRQQIASVLVKTGPEASTTGTGQETAGGIYHPAAIV